jgi:hypothetical protein
MKKIIYFLFLLSGLSACKNDLQVNAPWKETAVVYGLLNPSDSFQYVRIERTYLNDGTSALRVASIGDSIYFDTLVVALLEFGNNGNFIKAINMTLDQTLPKDSGLFVNVPNYIYKVAYKINPTFTYQLNIKNAHTGKEYKSTTQIVTPSFVKNQMKEFFVAPARTYKLSVISGRNSYGYEAKVKFNYSENDTVAHTLENKSFEWIFAPLREINASSGVDQLEAFITGGLMYDYILQNIKAKPHVKRKMETCDVWITCAGEELMNYINLNKPSLGIVQKKPEYSNIENGLGIFSSRDINAKELKASDSFNHYLSIYPTTKALGFIDPF